MMNKQVFVISFSILLLIGAVIYLFLCSSDDQVKTPVRHKTIPHEAVWAGGVDGGSWISCSPLPLNRIDTYCKIYNDFTGNIDFESRFIFKQLNKMNIKTDHQAIYNYFDGTHLHLASGDEYVPDGKAIYPDIGFGIYSKGELIKEEK